MGVGIDVDRGGCGKGAQRKVRARGFHDVARASCEARRGGQGVVAGCVGSGGSKDRHLVSIVVDLDKVDRDPCADRCHAGLSAAASSTKMRANIRFREKGRSKAITPPGACTEPLTAVPDGDEAAEPPPPPPQPYCVRASADKRITTVSKQRCLFMQLSSNFELTAG